MSRELAPGVVRPARRPADFVAPGPPPRAPAGLLPGPGEDLCFLTGDWRIFQRQRGHRWSLDDLVTAHLALRETRGREVDCALDLGCGIGSVLLMVAWGLPRARCTGVEAQAASAALARRSLVWNGADDRVHVVDGDLRDAAVLPAGARFDLVTGTPPYFDVREGTVSLVPQRERCRFELRGGVEDYCEAAARWLAPGGTFALCAPAGHRPRLLAAATRLGLHVARFCSVVPRAGKPALIFAAALRFAPTRLEEEQLVVRGADGQWTAEFRALRREMGMPARP